MIIMETNKFTCACTKSNLHASMVCNLRSEEVVLGKNILSHWLILMVVMEIIHSVYTIVCQFEKTRSDF